MAVLEYGFFLLLLLRATPLRPYPGVSLANEDPVSLFSPFVSAICVQSTVLSNVIRSDITFGAHGTSLI